MERTAPETWHHGLVARWWSEFNRATEAELSFYARCIQRFGEPVLDLACGTGRLLVPLVSAGFDIDGIDVSADMLQHARSSAADHGVQPLLLRQAMHELDPPRQYRVVYLCDSFGIGGVPQHDETALERIHESLEPGGALILTHDLPFGESDQWKYWLGEHRRELPQAWGPPGDRRVCANGEELQLMGRLVDLDPRSQVVTMQLRPRLWRGETLLAEEEHTIRTSLYFENELRRMLLAAGFRSVDAKVAYSMVEPGPNDTSLVFIATRD